MIIVVDSNILFSACISTEKQNRLSALLFSRQHNLQRISCYYAIAELFRHREKLIKASKLPAEKLNIILYEILKQITFHNEDTIEQTHWVEADRLTKDVDSKDISFVALALQTNGFLWTGDQKLSRHLKTIGFNRVVSTSELYELLNIE